MSGSNAHDLGAADHQTIESLVDRVAHLEALLQRTTDATGKDSGSVMSNGQRKPKGGPIDDALRKTLVTKRERLELARLAEQAAWEDLKVEVRAAAEAGVSYREIGDAIGVTRARVYQIVSGKR
jgi:alkylhydroperoxidase/carboxymuconolactone decarboxylase family protein YurZ